jgi:ferritin-like metal-binding protein YciE
MKMTMDAINSTEESFLQQIQQLFSAEEMLTKAIPKLMEKAKSFGLKKNLALHLAETDQHKEALRLICKSFGVSADGTTSNDMQAIIAEGDNAISSVTGEDIDAAIIAAAKKVEQWEIAQYEVAAQAAKAWGYQGIAARLRLTQEEEVQTLTKLNFMERELPYRKVQKQNA